MAVQSSSSYCYNPTVESLQKLQGILTKKLNRELSQEETKIAYHNLMGYAVALVDLLPNSSKIYIK